MERTGQRLSIIPTLGLALLSMLSAPLAGQQPEPCSTMDQHRRLLATDPEYALNQQAIEARTLAFLANGAAGPETIRRIPVVVHVLWNTAAQNIPDSQIHSQIQVLNEDFRRQNADAENTLSQFQGVAADCEFEFCLASVDPQGGATSGITRTSTSVVSFNGIDNAMKFNLTGGRNAWPRDQYLNIWVCNLSGGLLGYAQFPGGSASTDGVVLKTTAFGRTGVLQEDYDRGRATTHEVGHWLNLRHVWGDQQPNCADDFVADTPPSAGPNFYCPLGFSSCGGVNMVQNYMDYTSDACKNLFTQGQKARMQALFAPGGARAALLSSPAACGNTPVPPNGAFQMNQPLSSLAINGVQGTATQPAIVTVPVGTTIQAQFASVGAGSPWDTIFSFAPLVAAGSGAYSTPGGQVFNIDPAAPYVWLNSGTTSPNPFGFPGTFTTQATPQFAGTCSFQQFIVTAALPDGYALSQGCQLVTAPGPGGCPVALPAGPTGDDTSVLVNLGNGSCAVPVAFYGYTYTQFYVQSNGRITFRPSNIYYGTTVAYAASGVPFVGFWTDLDPSYGGSIVLTRPTATRFRVAWNTVPYYNEFTTSSFAIEIDLGGAIVLDNLLGIRPNPETFPAYLSQNQFLGLSPGAGSTTPQPTTFVPGYSGGTGSATDMLYDFYNAATTYGGRCLSLASGVNRITFTPTANGNYTWSAN